jgi:hypothetical protein
MYNYHWVLDDQGWPHTAVLPDAAVAMDNGAAGVKALGAVAILPTTPGWNTRPMMPPYCTSGDCAEIKNVLELATAPRLLGVPEQQILHISNQVDDVQRNTTLFPSTAAWLNTLHGRHCAAQGIPGIHDFLRASTATVHTEIGSSAWDNVIIGGTRMRDWVAGVFTAPAAVIDKVALGTLEADIPGVQPFPCTVGSPSGAFLTAD